MHIHSHAEKFISFNRIDQKSTENTYIGVSSIPVPGDVWFSLRNKTYQNHSHVILEEIGESHDALLCVTNFTTCCQHPHTKGNWFFPNGTRVPSSGAEWDIYRTRGHMVVYLHRRKGGVEGMYRCEILDSTNIMQTIYIGVYTPKSREC